MTPAERVAQHIACYGDDAAIHSVLRVVDSVPCSDRLTAGDLRALLAERDALAARVAELERIAKAVRP